MTLRTVICGIAAILIVIGSASQMVEGVYDIDNPVENAIYLSSSNIQTWGNTDMGEDVYVELEKGSATGAEQLIQVPPQDIDWDHDFSAPSGGWALGND